MDSKLTPFTPLSILFLLSLSWSALGYLYSADPERSLYLTIQSLGAILLYLGLILHIQKENQIEVILKTLLCFGGVLALVGILQQFPLSILKNPITHTHNNSTSLFAHKNIFSGYLIPLIPLSCLVYLSSFSKVWKCIAGIIFILFLIALGFSGSRGGQLVAILFLLTIMGYLVFNKDRKSVIFLTLGIFISVILSLIIDPIVKNLEPQRISAPTGVSVSASPSSGSVVNKYVVTTVEETIKQNKPFLKESAPSSEVSTTNDLSTAGNKNTISWSAVTGATRYKVYKGGAGEYTYIGQTPDTSFEDDNISPDLVNPPPQLTRPRPSLVVLISTGVAGALDSQWIHRISFWQGAWEIFKDHWLIGSGPNSFHLLFPKYWIDIIPILKTPISITGVPPHAHNLFAQTASDSGLIGIGLMLAFLTIFYIQAYKLFRFSSLGSRSTVFFFTSAVTCFLVHHMAEYNWPGPMFIYHFTFFLFTIDFIYRKQFDSKKINQPKRATFILPTFGIIVIFFTLISCTQYYKFHSALDMRSSSNMNLQEFTSRIASAKQSCPRCDRPYMQMGLNLLVGYRVNSEKKFLLLAKNELLEGRKLNPYNPYYMGYLGQVFVIEGDYGRALSILREALKFNKTHHVPIKNMMMGLSAVERQRLDQEKFTTKAK